eukprot:3660319-Rhodomonas_salina.1
MERAISHQWRDWDGSVSEEEEEAGTWLNDSWSDGDQDSEKQWSWYPKAEGDWHYWELEAVRAVPEFAAYEKGMTMLEVLTMVEDERKQLGGCWHPRGCGPSLWGGRRKNQTVLVRWETGK